MNLPTDRPDPEHSSDLQDGDTTAPASLHFVTEVPPPDTSPAPRLADFPQPPPLSPALPNDVPRDLRTVLTGIDLAYLVGFYFIAGAVLTVIVAVCAMFALHITPATLQDSVGPRAIVMIVSQGLLSGATLLFLYAMIRARTTAPFWPQVGWRPFPLRSTGFVAVATAISQCILGGIALAFGVGWLSKFLESNTTLPMEGLFHSRQTVLLLMALGILVAPLVEETIFRGCIYPVIARKFGIRAGVIVTGTLFGLAHAQQLWGGWGQIALLICVGIVLTYIRSRTGTVAASYFVHLTYNSILFVGFYFATGGLRTFPPPLGP